MLVGNEKLKNNPKPRKGTHSATLSIVQKAADGGVGIVKGSIPLWIHEIETAFGISGSSAQSASKREFYPRNFNQPTYTFRGQSHSEHEYTTIAEFIRDGQLGCIFGDRLFIISAPAAGPVSEIVNTVAGGKSKGKARHKMNRNLKGRRPGIRLQGYIQTAQRSHERWVNAPEYEFEFVVSRSLAGPILDEAVKPHVLPVNWDQFVARSRGGMIADPDKAILDEDLLDAESKKESGKRPDEDNTLDNMDFDGLIGW